MKTSRTARVFTFFLMAQFLNVQVQAAFGNEAIAEQDQEIRMRIETVKERLGAKLERMGEDAVLHFAYRLFKKDIKFRNRAFMKSDEEFRAGVMNPKDQDLIPEVKEEQENLELFADLPPVSSKALSHREIRREQMITHADQVLVWFGAKLNSEGKLDGVSFEAFKAKINEMKSSDLRAPASTGCVILKIILALLVISVGLMGVMLIIALVAFGSTSPLLWILAAGIIVGEFFSLKGIFSIQCSRDPFLTPFALA